MRNNYLCTRQVSDLEAMGRYFDMLTEDVRVKEGLKACMNCGVCTAICPAAEFYDYDPRQIITAVQSRSDAEIERLLRSETIWYCGQCMSCRPRCPRGNTPGYIIQALRTLSQRLGLFVESEKGRQQLAIKRTIGHNIWNSGYCLVPRNIEPDKHLEQGTVWRWIFDHDKDIYPRFTPSYGKEGSGALRKFDEKTMNELHRIFEVSGGTALFDDIERYSEAKAREMGYDGADERYMNDIYTKNSMMEE